MTDARTPMRLDLDANETAVRQASEWATEFAARNGLSEDDVYRLDLCVCEVVTNIVSYAFDGEGAHSIELSAHTLTNAVVITISDGGRAFDPLALAPPETPYSLEDMSIGGLGIDLVRKFSDECSYKRAAGRNILSFTIRYTASQKQSRLPRGVERRRSATIHPFPIQRANGTVVEKEQRSRPDRRVLGAISAFKMLRGIPYSAMEDIVSAYPIRVFKEAEILLRPGDRNQYVALVIAGHLKVHLDSPGSREFVEIGPGECVGEMSIIDGEPISAFVIAEAGCELLLIDPESFLTRVMAVPGVARNLLMMLSERMRITNRQAVGNLKNALELESLQRELKNAQDMQASMVPERHVLATDDASVECSGYMHAAKQVGGDFYDAFLVGPDRVFVAIGDVCGKGMAAALFMARTMTLLRSEASHSAMSRKRHTRDILARVNNALAVNNSGSMFATVFCGVLDVPTGKFTFVNAGHNPPLVMAPGAAPHFLAGPRNPVVGVIEGLQFELGEIKLAPGSTLLLYTDGVTEAENATGDMFGDERLLGLFPYGAPGNATATVDTLVAAINDFAVGHAQSDDITMLALTLAAAPAINTTTQLP